MLRFPKHFSIPQVTTSKTGKLSKTQKEKKSKMMKSESAAIHIPESSSVAKGKALLFGAGANRGGGYKRGVAGFDLFLRIAASVAAFAATFAMANSEQTLPFFTQFLQFDAGYDDLPTGRFFVVGMAIVGAYFSFSLPLSIVGICRPQLVTMRIVLLLLDTVALALNIAAASAEAALVYVAHNGSSDANWLPVCQQFGDFCQQTSGAVVAAFVSAVFIMFLILTSALLLKRH